MFKYKYLSYLQKQVMNVGTIIGGLSPRRIRSDPIGSANQSARRSAEADSGGPQKSPPSLPESAADPIGSAINWRTVRQKMAEKSLNRKVRGGQSTLFDGQSPLLGGQSPPGKIGGLNPRRTKSAIRPPCEK